MSRAFIACAATLLAVGSTLFAQSAPSTQEDLTPLQRWERLDPEEQERMRSRFERWTKLSKEEQRDYLRRSEERKRASKEALRFLRPEDRASFKLLDKETQEGVMRELTHMKLLERGHRLRGMFPRESRERLESATPEERKAILDEFRKKELKRAGERALKDLSRDLELDEAEVEGIRNMKRERRHEELLRLKRRAIELGQEEEGDLAALGESEWERMKRLAPRDFAREWFNHRDRTDKRGGDKLHRQLHELMRPTLEELVQVSRVPEAERRQLINSLIRGRLEDFMDSEGAVPEELAKSFAGLSDQEAVTRLHHYLRSARGGASRDTRRPKGGGERRERRGRPGGPGGPPPHGDGGSIPPPRGGPGPHRAKGGEKQL